jgi:hypothetical protein
MNKTKWHKGAPPSIGWWPAGLYQKLDLVRWWNGEYWSVGVPIETNSNDAGEYAIHKTIYSNKEIKWSERWWL